MLRLSMFAVAAALAALVPLDASASGAIAGKLEAKSAKLRRNAVVYLEQAPAGEKPGVVQMDQKNQIFLPMVLPVVEGTTVEFLNNDATGHNVFSPDGQPFDLGVFEQGQSRKHTFSRRGVYTILCKMHPSMIAYVVALQNPYFALTGEDGSFRIEKVPPGEYRLMVWHERKKVEPLKVVVAEGATAQVELTVK